MMRKYFAVFLIVLLPLSLWSQTPDPGRTPRWDKALDYIKNGQFTMAYKTLTSPTISGNITTTGSLDMTMTNTAAGGDKAVNASITQSTNALTGNLIAGAFVATNSSVAAANGVIYGLEVKSRAATSGNVGNTIGRLDGVYASVDAKNKTATTMRAFEASLDGGAGGSSTEAVAFEAFNNSSATQTASYAFSANGGTASGHKVYTADMRMQNGELFDNATDGTVQVTSNVIKHAYDSGDYWTATQANGGAVTFASTSTGTAGFTFSQLTTHSAGINLGTSQSIVGTTGLTIGGGTETVAINSSDWDIDATGTATNMGSFTSNGDATFTGGDFTGSNGNAIDIGEAADGTITFSRDDAGTVTLTSADSDADAALTVSAGGAGALTIGDGGSTTSITSSDWAIGATGDMTGIGSIAASGAIGMADDQVLTLGTTTTNGETKVTLEFDETTTGIGAFHIGDLSNPQVLNASPGATVIPEIVNINHSAGAGDCENLIAAYEKINVIGVGDADMTVVGTASRAYVGLTGGSNNSVAKEVYGAQPWARHQGTGAVTAISGLSAMLQAGDDNFTATTANAGHFHIDGAADVTGQYDGVMIEAYPDVDTMDALLALAVDSGGDVGAGIRITGAPACQMLLSSGAKIFTGTAANGNAVYSEVGAIDATGSIYISTGNGYIYIQVANAGNESDWYKVTASNTD